MTGWRHNGHIAFVVNAGVWWRVGADVYAPAAMARHDADATAGPPADQPHGRAPAGTSDGAGSAARRRRPKGPRQIIGWLAGFLVVVLGSEFAVRAAAPHLSDPHNYFSDVATEAVHSMDTLRAHGIRSDLTFVGTSMVRRDVDADTMEAKIPDIHWAHNVGLPGAQSTVVERWLLQEVIPRLHPKRVVWGISSLDFNSGRPDHPIDQYNTARATEPGFFGDLDRIMWNSDISQYRDQLRDPYTLYTDARGRATHLVDHRPLKELATYKVGFPNHPSAARLKKTRATHFTRTRQLRNYKVGTDELAAYTTVLDSLRRQHIEVAIVIMPVPKLYLKAHPHGRADYDHWKSVVVAAAAKRHVPVVDMWDSMPDSSFRDTEHLDAAPAHVFSRMLADRLLGIGF